MTIAQTLDRARREEYLTVIQFAALCQYDPQTIYRKIRDGQIPGIVRLGRSIRIVKRIALSYSAQVVTAKADRAAS